jgi:hypothetical protein
MKRAAASILAVALLAAVAVTDDAQRARQRQGRGQGQANRNPLKAGDKAPDFELKNLKGEGKFKLSSNFGKRPTVLIFGSYT